MAGKQYRVVSVANNGYRFVVAASVPEAQAYRTAWRLQLVASEEQSSTRYLVEEV